MVKGGRAVQHHLTLLKNACMVSMVMVYKETILLLHFFIPGKTVVAGVSYTISIA